MGSEPWWCPRPVCQRAFSVVGPSERGWCRAEPVSGCLRRGCTLAPESPLHSGRPGTPSDTHRYGVGCRSHGSGRGAGSQLKREHRWISSVQQVMLEHVTPQEPPLEHMKVQKSFPATACSCLTLIPGLRFISP